MSTHFTPMTDEQRQIAKQSRLDAQEYARTHLKHQFVDHPHWISLASKYNCKLPGWWYPSTEIKYLRRIAKKANFDLNLFVQSTGCSNIKEYGDINSNWSVLGLCGVLLEYIDQENTLNLFNNTGS